MLAKIIIIIIIIIIMPFAESSKWAVVSVQREKLSA